MSLFKILFFLCQCDKALRGGPDFRRLSVLVFCRCTLQCKSKGLPHSKVTGQSGVAFLRVEPPVQKPPLDSKSSRKFAGIIQNSSCLFPCFFNAD